MMRNPRLSSVPLSAVTAVAAVFSHFSDIEYIFENSTSYFSLDLRLDVHLISWNSNEPRTYFVLPLSSGHTLAMFRLLLDCVCASAAHEREDSNKKVALACKYMPARGDHWAEETASRMSS